MSSYVGVIFIDKCTSIVSAGDGNKLTPKLEEATYRGAGSFNIGDLLLIANKENKTEVIDNDIVDQGFILNL